MDDFIALFYLCLRDLHHQTDATIGNVFACLSSANRCAQRQGPEYKVFARAHLNKACQHLWGNTPPQSVKVNDKWEYSLRK